MAPDLQPERTAVKHNSTRRPVELPPERLHLVMMPGGIQRRKDKEPTKVIGQNADAKEDRVGAEMTAGHTLHAKTDLELLDPVLTVLAPLIVPLQNLFGGSLSVCGNNRIPNRRLPIVKELSLMGTAYHYQAKGMPGVVHAMHRLSNVAVLI